MSEIDSGFKNKFDTTKMSVEDLKMCKMDSGVKHKFDTTKMSVEDLKMCKMEEPRRPSEPPAGKLHPHPQQQQQQEGRPGLRKTGRYPVVLAGMAVLSGISTFMYYRSVHVQPIHGNNQSMLQDSVHVATGNAPAD